ncbi:MAG: RDD family protein [Rudaea sp.]|uniref:RDD family protein n=1 Tax=unclassified Rudaea TaxID=2627037 RepID=UPI0010F7CD2F|nr:MULTISPECIES: RDD family protein [unclassified Rudaea]MBN8885893.1 RDD family protein [Rudaea sp.]MBR0343767.1 RDD family protein [Rudaea sp.]
MNSIPERKAASPAHLGWRLTAAVYDFLPLLALWFLASGIALAITGGALDVHRLGYKLLVQIFVLGASAAYFIVSWMRGGQTVGMKPWRLRVVGEDGESIGFRRALLRFVVAVASLAVLGLGFLWCLVDREKRSWHDIAAGTLLVRLDKNP